jgi:hypothetical protein
MTQINMTQAENYQPQVRDTTTGPNVHTYIPRADGSIVIGGVTYLPQTAVAATVANPSEIPIPLTMHSAVGPPNPIAFPYVIPPGGPAIPVVANSFASQCSPFASYPLPPTASCSLLSNNLACCYNS